MRIWILEKKLTDGSPVYDVRVNENIPCESRKQAEFLADALKSAIDKYSLAQVSTEYNY